MDFFFFSPENLDKRLSLKKHVQLPLFSGAPFENILAIDGHTWHQPMQDRFLYLYIKILKKKKTYKMFKKMFEAGGKAFFISQDVLIWY